MKIRIAPQNRIRTLKFSRDKNTGILLDLPPEKVKEYRDIIYNHAKMMEEMDIILQKVAPNKLNALLFGTPDKK